MSRFDDYLNSVNGVAIDVDGNWGAQCWDLWSHYAMNMFGASMWATSTNCGGSYHHPGYACEIWHNFSGGPLGRWFTPVGADQPAQRGDVVLWEWGSAVGPNSHVAIVVEDRGGSLYCMTQNPGASHYGNLSKSGVLGYLRPDDQSIFGGAGSSAVSNVSGSVSELADAVLRGDYGNGPARQAALGDRFDEVQAEVNRRLNGGTPAPESAPAPSGTTYTVVPGDTLWGISESFYGTGTEWPRIYEANAGQIANPNLIFPGQILTIP